MKSKTVWCGAALAAIAWSAPVWAQADAESEADGVIYLTERPVPILVTASRDMPIPVSEFTGSLTLITPEQIDRRQIRDIADVLRDVPSVAVSSVAGQTQIRMRGSEANHVLVLVDGIEVSDPNNGEFDIGTLQAEIGSRLEVLRGPQSALYGNDAVAGVVAYNAASGRELSGFSARIEGGTNSTVNGAARYGYRGDGWDAALSATVVSTEGEPNARNGTRDIGRDSYTISGKGAVEVADGFELRSALRYVETEGEFNDQDFGFGSPTQGFVIDSPGTQYENQAFYALVGARFEALDGAWIHDLSAQVADIDRNTVAPAGFPSETESDRFKASYVTAYDFGGNDHTVTFAADYEVEGFNNVLTFDDRREIENVGLVGEYRYSGERFDFAAAVRHDINDRFQDATTFRIGAGMRVTDTTRLRAAFGTGVKNPTFGELFGFFDGVFVGNPNLQPEESTSWEVGVDQDFVRGAVRVSLTYFDAELENEIFTAFPPPDFIQTPGNRATDSTQRGVELAIAAQLGSGFSFNGAYSFVDAEEDGVEEVRRPDHLASAVLNWAAPRDDFSANLAVRYHGEAQDSDFTVGAFPAPQTTLDDYVLVNVNARVKLAEGIDAFGRVENLLDETYEPVFTFVAPGRAALIGIEARF
ncbi:TonB-dependent siderophore receptor [Erythrobacter sp. JK5]|uniref:TonB-dependent receptor plug domain-containing protein n=1 Tax=Erythrobacter sp. JK5 TaxID=2829500 RepID=UPI001BAA9CA9|nr:TonB-dependent receptor [Erythrobacter sp. JK5]QUL36537.1 TonB-dependent receptor [Erythrobacter sp. JK5]